MNQKKIVKTGVSNAPSSKNIVFINVKASKSRLKPIEAICEGLVLRSKVPQVFLVGSSAEEWNGLMETDHALKECLTKGLINAVKSIEDIDLTEKDNLFFLPLKFNRTSSSYAKVLAKIAGIAAGDASIFALGKNTSKKKSLGSRIFGTIANASARIIHGIDAQNIANEVIGFSTPKYNELTAKYGKNNSPLVFLKQAVEEGEELNALDGDYGDPAYGFGAGFAAIVQSKVAVAKSLPQRFFKVPLKDIKENGLQLAEKDSSFYKLSYFIATILVFLTMMFTATDFNVTWDEPGHIAYGEDIYDYYISAGSDTTVFEQETAGKTKGYDDAYAWYGASVDTIAEAFHRITNCNIYSVRRYVMGFVSFFMLLIIALLAKHFFGWRAALLALLAAYFSPSFHGHFFNNHKDIPFALGYIMTAYYLILTLEKLPKPNIQNMFMLALGIGFSLSVRASGLAQFAFVIMFMGLHWMIVNKSKNFGKYILMLLGVLLTAYVIGIALWPAALRDPISAPFNAFKQFSNFQALHYMELFEGVRLKDKPWYYEPKLILITAPLMLIAGWALFIVTSLIKRKPSRTFGLTVLLVMAFAPTVYAIMKDSYLYNGWRHFLFIYPILVVLCVWGFEKLMEILKGVKLMQLILPALAFVLLIPAISFHARNHPYQYMYFNELVGGVKGAAGNYELDYWSQTPKEGFKWMIDNIPEAKTRQIKYSSNNIEPTLVGMNEGGDSFKFGWCREAQWYDKVSEYNFFTTRTLSKNQILNGNWPPMGTIHEIKVDGVTVAAVVKKPNNYGGLATNFLNKNNINEALINYEKAFKANPKEEEYARGIGMIYKTKRNWDSAILFFNIASELRDHNYNAFHSLGECYLNKATLLNQQNPDPKLIAEAKKYFELTAKYKSNYSSAFYFLGAIAQNENRDYDAIKYFSQTLKINPNATYAYNGIAKSYDAVGKLDSAIINYTFSLQISEMQKKPDPQVYGLLAQLYQKKGDTKTAQQLMQKYQQLMGGAPQQ